MGQLTSRTRVLRALNLQIPDRIPFIDDIEPQVRAAVAGSSKYSDLQVIHRLGMDALDYRGKEYWSPLFCEMHYKDGREYLADGLIKSEKDIKLMNFPNPGDPALYEPLKRFVEKYGKEEVALFVYMAWGIDCVLASMGFDAFARALYEDRGLVEKVLDLYCEWNMKVVEQLNGVGIDFISSYNNLAFNSGPLFSPQVLRELFLPKMKKVAEACKLPWVFHSDGNLTTVLEDLLTLGMQGLHPIDPLSMDLKSIKKEFGHRVCLWGNVDLSYTLTRGTPEEVESEVKRCIRDAGPGGGFILGSANCLPSYVKTENVLAMAGAAKKYGSYPLDYNLL